MKVAVFGAGTMGLGIIQVFAEKGNTVLVYDISMDFVRNQVQKLKAMLAKRVEKGRMTQEAMDAIMANVLVEEKTACADAALVVECVKEDMAVKKSVLKELDDICGPDTVFTTNTSSGCRYSRISRNIPCPTVYSGSDRSTIIRREESRGSTGVWAIYSSGK